MILLPFGAVVRGSICHSQCLYAGIGGVIAIDRISERLEMAEKGGAETLNFEKVDVGEALKEMTGERGPD